MQKSIFALLLYFHYSAGNTLGYFSEIDNKTFVARVDKKEVAKQEYDAAVASGQTAAHVQTR